MFQLPDIQQPHQRLPTDAHVLVHGSQARAHVCGTAYRVLDFLGVL